MYLAFVVDVGDSDEGIFAQLGSGRLVTEVVKHDLVFAILLRKRLDIFLAQVVVLLILS